MKRVLFVDDDPSALEGLRKMIAPRKGAWQMAFAPDGEEALTLLDTAPCDVIVSGIRQPANDGATLLKTVCARFPAVVRIALLSRGEMDNALRAVSVAHQFLVKPCDLTMLRVAIERATSLSDLLNNKFLARTTAAVQDLPILPRTYFALRSALANPNISLQRIARIIEQDVSVSAKVLQFANSAFFGLPREISTVETAVAHLGAEMLRPLVLSAGVFHVFERANAVKGFSFEDLHLHSQLVARIAGRIPATSHVSDIAIVAGLLHDVGKLVRATRSPEHLARALGKAQEENIPVYLAEERLIGASHAEVGAYLLGLWGLPTPVVEAVAHHHHPRRIPHDLLGAIGIVHIANALAHKHPVRPPLGDLLPHQEIDAEYVEALEITDQIPAWEELAETAASELRGVPTGVC